MKTKHLGKQQLRILKLLSVKGTYMTFCLDHSYHEERSFTVHYSEGETEETEDAADSFDISERLFDSLISREGLFKTMDHPTSLQVEIEAYELTDEARNYFRKDH